MPPVFFQTDCYLTGSLEHNFQQTYLVGWYLQKIVGTLCMGINIKCETMHTHTINLKYKTHIKIPTLIRESWWWIKNKSIPCIGE